MIIQSKRATSSLLILKLILGVMTPLSLRAVSIPTTTLALLYDERASVLACDLQDPILSEIPEIHQMSIQVLAQEAQDKIAKYSDCEGILTVYEVPHSQMTLVPLDPAYTSGYQWNLSGIDLPSAWNITTGSDQVIVAVIDTGVNSTSSLTDFGSDGLVLGASIINGVTRLDTYTSQYTYDGGSHGTAVASLIAANMNASGITGVALGVKIMPVKVFKDATVPNEVVSALNTDIAAAIIWATDHGADIINMSIGGPSDAATQSAVEYADAHGVIMVAASGNNSNNPLGTYVDVSYPAAYPQVIAVGSLDPEGIVSFFTNVAGEGLDLSAYGEHVYLPWLVNGAFLYLSGTSFSSPTVAGVLALMKSVYPDLNPSEAKAILLSGVTDIVQTDYDPGWDVWSGYGLVNALNALVQAADYATYTDDNTDPASAQFIYGHHAYTSQLRPALDKDYYDFTLYETDDVTITLSTLSIQDLVFEVFDATMTRLIFVDEEGSGLTETVTLSALSPGTYTVKVSDFADRGYLADYQIEVDYASATLPVISATTEEGALSLGQNTVFPVTVSVIESLYHTIAVTLDGLAIEVPVDLIFTDYGTYEVTVTEVLGGSSSFTFTIKPIEGYQPHLKVSLIGTGGILTMKAGETALALETDVDQGTEITLNVELAPNTRVYRWTINGVIQTSREPILIKTVNYTSLTITVELGLIGDLNLTEDVTTTDLVQLRRALAGLETISDKSLYNADLNADGQVTTTDLVKLRRFLAGLE